MEIIVTVRNVYGNELVYPVNDAAKALAEIAGTKTLSHHALCLAERLGHTVWQQASSTRFPPATTRSHA